MVSDLLLIATFFANVITQIFLGLDTVKYEGISILDLFCALWFFRLIVWFIWRILTGTEMRGGEYEEKERSEGGKR